MKNSRSSFEELMKKNKRESAFSKRMDSTPGIIDENLLNETREFYESVVKPTVQNGFRRLVESN